MIPAMRTALLALTLLCLTGCWKEIHEARAPQADPLHTAVASASPLR
jgi:hypothetical protein